MRVLLFLTVEWPYDHSEAFIENEVPYAKGFDRIYCLPLYGSDNLRDIPPNISLVKAGSHKMQKLDYLNGLFQIDFWKEVKVILFSRHSVFQKLSSLFKFSGVVAKRKRTLQKWIANNIGERDDLTIYTYWMASDAVAASLLKRKDSRVKRVASRCHGFDVYEYRNTAQYLPYRSLLFRELDVIAPISEDGYLYLTNKYESLEKEKVVVSKLGTEDWGLNPENDRSEEPLSIVSCSYLNNNKRVNLMIRAFNELKVPVIWRHFGDGPLRRELEAMVEQTPGEKNFLFMGQVENRELMKWYSENHVDLFVNTSENEGLPVSIMEAMSFGIPAIATDAGGTSEIVLDHFNGFLLKKDFQISELTDAIMLYKDLKREQKKKQRKNARSLWEKNHSAEVNYPMFYKYVLKADE